MNADMALCEAQKRIDELEKRYFIPDCQFGSTWIADAEGFIPYEDQAKRIDDLEKSNQVMLEALKWAEDTFKAQRVQQCPVGSWYIVTLAIEGATNDT